MAAGSDGAAAELAPCKPDRKPDVKRSRLTPCCQCNGQNAWCKSCSCVRKGQICTNCSAAKNGHCSNSASIQPLSHTAEPQQVRISSTVPLPIPVPVSVENTAMVGSPDSIVFDDTMPGSTIPQILVASEPLLPTPRIVSEPSEPSFRWGSREGRDIVRDINSAYEEVIHWKRNNFLIPFGSIGKEFVQELARLFQAFADGSSLESVVMKATSILPILLLQKPSKNSKYKDQVKHLKRRLDLWNAGDINALLDEGRCIQHYVCTKKHDRMQSGETVARKFDSLMKHGRTRDAIRLLSSSSNGKVLQLHDSVFEMTSTGEQISRSVRDILSDKHPKGIPPVYSSLLQDNPAPVNPILFDQLTAQSIYQAALHTEGSSGLSGLDAYA